MLRCKPVHLNRCFVLQLGLGGQPVAVDWVSGPAGIYKSGHLLYHVGVLD